MKRHYEFTKTITIHGEIEAKSKKVAEKIVELMDLYEATQNYIGGSDFEEVVCDYYNDVEDIEEVVGEISQYGEYETEGKIVKKLDYWTQSSALDRKLKTW